MSQTLYTTRQAVRTLMNDVRDGAEGAVSNERINQAIDNRYAEVNAELGYSDTQATAYLSYTAGTFDYPLTGSEYQSIQSIKRTEDHWNLIKRNGEAMENLRTGGTVAQGKPTDYYLWDDGSQKINLRLYPTPNVNGTLDVFYSLAGTQLVNDADTIPLARTELRMLELFVAAELLTSLAPKALDMLQLSPNIGASYQARAEQLLDMAKERRTTWRRSGRIERVRY